MSTEGRPPNVIWIFGDQHRAQALGTAGDPNVATPSIDRLAEEGLVFTHAVCGSPLCSPFRGSLLNGTYPHHCVPDNGDALPHPEQVPTVSTLLRRRGYTTCYLGKWHVCGTDNRTGGPKKLTPDWQRHDWDEWLGYDNNNKQYDCWVHGGPADQPMQHYRLPGYETDCLTDLLIDRLRGWGRQQADDEATAEGAKPFFAALSVQPPHSPYVAPPRFMARHRAGRVELRPNVPPVAWVRERARRELAGYYAQIENLDYNIGRVWDTLHETGLYDNTIVMIFSDHGDMHGSQGRFNKSVPWEESIRIPFVVAGQSVKYGQGAGRTDVPINHVDILPTTLGLCGLEVPDHLPGFDYSELWTARTTTAEPPDSAYLQLCSAPNLPAWRGLVTRDGWKYAVMPGQPWLMYNLNDDPYETMNVVFLSTYFDERRRLHERLRQWIADTGDPFEMPGCD